ncbi:hypothetical protein C8J56DRAFT_1033343 [Mycena floridula]|nr:hypothetical protein C8J56DRAFT_1033343 [Mycena floridula]
MRVISLITLISLAVVVSTAPLQKPSKTNALATKAPASKLPATKVQSALSAKAKPGPASKAGKPHRWGKAKKVTHRPASAFKGAPKGAVFLGMDAKSGHFHAFSHQMQKLGSFKHPGIAKAASKSPKGKASTAAKGDKSSTAAKAPGKVASKASSTSKAPAAGKTSNKVKRHFKLVRRADSSPCQPLSVDNVQKIPGWSTVVAAAQKNWGTGSYNLVTNDPDFKDAPALACVQTSSVTIIPDSDPTCTSADLGGQGQLQSNGSVTLGTSAAGTSTVETTVTQESSLMVGSTTTVGINIEGIKAEEAITVQATVTNTVGSSNSASTTVEASAGITYTPNPGQKCSASLIQTTCSMTGHGQVDIQATGWVWFEFNDQTNGHYKWALNLDAVLPNAKDRSSPLQLKAAAKSKSRAKYEEKCTTPQ